jgi:hypothetical protein
MNNLSSDQKNIKSLVEAQLPTIRTLPDPDRSRCLLCMAYEYFVLDMEEYACSLLQEADPEYFGEQLGKDMKDIEEMSELVLRITDKLVDIGFVIITTKGDEDGV